MTQVLTIAAEWEIVAEMIENRDEADLESQNEWRRLFYGGAKAVLLLLREGASQEALNDECTRFGEMLLAGQA